MDADVLDDPYMQPRVPEPALLDRLGLRPVPRDDNYKPPKWRRQRVRIDTSDD